MVRTHSDPSVVSGQNNRATVRVISNSAQIERRKVINDQQKQLSGALSQMREYSLL
jgi:hypothetical protein